MKRMRVRRPVKFVLMGILAMFALVLFGFVVMLLWNSLMPDVFGAKTVSYWQAVGLLILGRMFFGGFRGRPNHATRWRRSMERWEQMTPEEREKFREGIRRSCGPVTPEAKTEA
jgi:hypothetical protein